MQDISNHSIWLIIKTHLESSMAKASTGLQNLSNTHEKDIEYKSRIAIIKELLDMPRTIKYAANT